MPETDETPTPLWKLSERWAFVQPQPPWRDLYAQGYAHGISKCRDALEAALAAFDVDAAARELHDDWCGPCAEIDDGMPLEKCEEYQAIAAALRAAAAAGARDGWKLCPKTGEPHAWYSSNADTQPRPSDWCVGCQVRRHAIAPAGPEEEAK